MFYQQNHTLKHSITNVEPRDFFKIAIICWDNYTSSICQCLEHTLQWVLNDYFIIIIIIIIIIIKPLFTPSEQNCLNT